MLMTSLRRIAAWLVLGSLFALQGGALLEARHPDSDDTACTGVSATGAHHAGGTQFEIPLPSRPLEHCAVCHLQRAFRTARPGSIAAEVIPHVFPVYRSEPAPGLVSATTHGVSPRGPPSVFV
jgi:hypothetical protein